MGSIFLRDGDYRAEVKALGYENVHFLPLATDHTLFKPRNGRSGSQVSAGFVGDSMIGPVEKYAAKVGLPEEFRPLVESAAGEFSKKSDRTPAALIKETGLDRKIFNGNPSPAGMLDLEALITWWSTKLYRLERVKALGPLRPTVVGDPGWRALLDETIFHLRPSLDYYLEMPWFYPGCQINLNATSMQMKTGLNQRVFDVPASEAFLLTDYREQIEGIFEVGREVVCYGHPEEALDLARYYLEHETQRRRVAERGLARVLSDHTYQCRLARLIEHMRQDHAV
jgi:spore maturation protein CgeB